MSKFQRGDVLSTPTGQIIKIGRVDENYYWFGNIDQDDKTWRCFHSYIDDQDYNLLTPKHPRLQTVPSAPKRRVEL